MTSHILNFVDSSNIQKSKYLENKIFLLQMKKFIYYTLKHIRGQTSNVQAEVTFNDIL